MRKPLAICVVLMLVLPAGAATAEDPSNCVGNPPRQTEDRLSPPCVPYFGGDNGGATDQGVTADEIRLVLYNDLGIAGDMNAPWTPHDEASDHLARHESRNLVRTIKAHLRYFASRFQTYGRTVRVIAQPSVGLTTPCSARQGDAAKARLNVDPFATISLSGGEISCYAAYMADRFGRPTFLYGDGMDRRVQSDTPGMIWSFMPDLQQQARASAGFICRKLAGRPARFTDDLTLKGRTRTFGLVYPSHSQRGPELEHAAAALRQALIARCGVEVEVETSSGVNDDLPAEAAAIMAKWKVAGITTVICYCVPVPSELTVPIFQRSATAIAYQPEWFWDSFSAMDKPMWQQAYGDRSQKSFGTSHFWRQPTFREQRHYQAYLEQEPNTIPNTRFSWNSYHTFLQAFTAIQLAGPNLDAASVAAGLRTHAVDQPTNPYVPRASYANGDSFVDSFTGWWWDPDGTPPDGTSNEGCNRVLREAYAFSAGTWTRGADDLYIAGSACNAPNQTAYP